MYITHFQLNPRRRGAMKLLTSPQAMHAAVLASFADPSETESGRVLWRRDRGRNREDLLIVSPQRPDLTHLVEQAGWPTTATWTTRPYAGVLARLAAGQRWRFRLTANPTTNGAADQQRGRGSVIPCTTIAQQEHWLRSRADRHGFDIPVNSLDAPELAVSERRTIQFARRQHTVTLATVTFEGILTVTDRDSFAHTLAHGIGRAKGYGCGLLTIAPADG